MAKKHASSKTTSLFDIRLKNLDHDVLVLKGNEQDAASVLLIGKLVFSLNESIQVKRLTLRLYATLGLEWTEQYQTSRGVVPKPMRFSKRVYEYIWDPNELRLALSTDGSVSTTSPALSRQHSSASLKNLGATFRSKSSTNLQASSLQSSSRNASTTNLSLSNSNSGNKLNGGGGSGTAVLAMGNHEIPFSAILPGSIPESVEGLPGGSVVYRLEAVIERGKFHTPLITKKQLRVVRTLTTDAVELSETVAVDNTWPKKVEYSLNVPSKAIAIGSSTPISFMLVPLLKGLRLGEIKIQLIEFYSFIGYIPPQYTNERLVVEKLITRPDANDPEFETDRWEIDTFLKIPDTLAKCTQDCDIQLHLKVRHKLKFVIGLVNPDGHVSELRASLPIQLFISPFVSIRARYDTESEPNALATGSQLEGAGDEELLFLSELHGGSQTSLTAFGNALSPHGHSEANSTTALQSLAETNANLFGGFVAPPLYEKHIYDRLWSDVSPTESPMHSGSVTPRSNDWSLQSLSQVQSDAAHQYSMSPLDTQKLSENLRQLSLQRQLQDGLENAPASDLSTTPNRATFELDGSKRSAAEMGDYFSLLKSNPHMQPSGMETPAGVLSPPAHLSRVGSDKSLLNSAEMVKVPSYIQAVRSDLQDQPLSPMYEPPLPGSHIVAMPIARRPEESMSQSHSRSQSRTGLMSSRTSSSNFLRSPNSRGSSLNSSPAVSRNTSSTNLQSANLPVPATSPGITVSPIPAAHTHTNTVHHKTGKFPIESLHTGSTSQLSSSASDRSAPLKKNKSLGNLFAKSNSSLNLQNMQFLHKKQK